MNWTGGALSRSRNTNAKASLSVKQKNYFAKARVNLQNGNRSIPPEIQYFDFGEWKSQNGADDVRRPNPIKGRGHASSQRTLDQFENVEGVVRKLKSLRPRKEGNKRKRSLINDTEGHVLPSGIPIPPVSPTIISSRSPLSSPIKQAKSTANRTSTASTSDESDPLAVLESVEAKRRKLLQENDWVGVERQRRMSKPVKMKFTDAKDRDLIGRRRPLNSSVVQNRWNVQGSRRMKIPLTGSHSEKPQGLHRGLVGEYWSGADEVSIRIGSTAMNRGPLSDEVLDCANPPGRVQRSSQSVKAFNHDNAGPTPKPQYLRREVTTPSASRDESSEPFYSLFSPEEVEQSGIAQLVEAATIAEDDHLALAEGELVLPEDYDFSEPEPGFRLIFEQTPQPRGRTSELNDSSSPMVRDFAATERESPRTGIEQSAHPEYRNVLEEEISESDPVEDNQSNTSPLSIATSRYMQELEYQSFGPSGRRLSEKNRANKTATAGAQPVINVNKAKEMQGTNDDREQKISVQSDKIQDKENIQPTEDEDEDETWLKFISLDDIHESQSNQEQPTTTQIPHATPRAPTHAKPALNQVSGKPNARKIPPPSPQDDELIWRNFIFSDSNPNDEWVMEEAAAAPESPSDNHISTYNPASMQPSMIAEAATSPVKQNPHLLEEMRDDDSSILVLDDDDDDASRQANASTSSCTTENVSSMRQQVSNPSDSPIRSSILANPASPSTQNPSSSLPPPYANAQISNPSSLIAEASSSIPTHRIQYLSPTNATKNNPSSDELAWTPSRLPSPPTAREKVVFTKPSRYIGERASDPPEPVHLGRKTSKGRKKTGATERAKGKAGRKGEGRNAEAGTSEKDEGGVDDIIDDWVR